MALKIHKINLDNIVSKAIHRPIITTKNGELPPLYTRVGNEAETEYMSEGTKNPLWVQASQTTYNSPTNVRRLFIGDSYVVIQYYQPPIIKGKSSGKYWYTYKINGIDNSLMDIAIKIYMGKMQGEAGGILQESEIVQFTQTGIGALSAHWKMSNIEELFITPAILMSEDITSGRELFNGFSSLGNYTTSDIPQSIFERVNGLNVKSIRSRFPRLRTVGIISNLDKLMEISGIQGLREGIPEVVSDLGVRWFEVAKSKGALKICSAVISDIPFDSKIYYEFNLRSGIYKYDDEVLSVYVDKYKEKVLEIGRGIRDSKLGKSTDSVNNTEASEYEKYLESLVSKYNTNIVSAALQLTFSRASKEDIDAVFDAMTTEGGVKYRKLLGR